MLSLLPLMATIVGGAVVFGLWLLSGRAAA